ncbi:hypothetical protein E1162_11625 [Rhodobacteraceae bacterium RKSG542]|uniref:hypothetical protein n=1 Tax=Pseudovibrio flavus TaxID=2529854 RepID=UPI0012BB65FD|nr:hypothetical protein [Pseudovibrio flavus]MTI17887.1 hypothetical protein [Pseudovibrio flavus]
MPRYDISFLCEIEEPEVWQVYFQKPFKTPVSQFPVKRGTKFQLLDYNYTQDTQILLSIPLRGLIFVTYDAANNSWNVGPPGTLISTGGMGVSILVDHTEPQNNDDYNPLNDLDQ